jgi:hypothetical protein
MAGLEATYSYGLFTGVGSVVRVEHTQSRAGQDQKDEDLVYAARTLDSAPTGHLEESVSPGHATRAEMLSLLGDYWVEGQQGQAVGLERQSHYCVSGGAIFIVSRVTSMSLTNTTLSTDSGVPLILGVADTLY